MAESQVVEKKEKLSYESFSFPLQISLLVNTRMSTRTVETAPHTHKPKTCAEPNKQKEKEKEKFVELVWLASILYK